MDILNLNKLLYQILSLAIFLSPFDTIRLPFIYLTISDIILILLFPLVLNSRNSFHLKSKISIDWTLALFLITLGYLISALGKESRVFITTITNVFQFSFILIYIPLILNKFKKYDSLNFLRIYIYGYISAILVSLLLEIAFPQIRNLMISNNLIINSRRFGAFIGSNGLAKANATILPLIFILYSEKKIKKNYLFLFIFILLISLIKASSNGGTIAFALSLFLSLIFIRDIKIKKNIVIITSLVAISVILFINIGILDTSLFTDRVYSKLVFGNVDDAGSFDVKSNLIKEGIRKIIENPLIGLGAGEYKFYSVYNNNVHNSYILFWSEGGILTFMGLILLLYSNIKIAFTKIKFSNYRTIINLTFVYLFIFMFNLTTDTQIYQRFRMIPFIIIYYVMMDLKTKNEIKL